MKFAIFTVAILTGLIQNGKGSRILAYIPTASYSHQVFYQQLWRELALRGHQMVVLTTDPTNETLANFKEISLRESYVPFNKMIELLKEVNAFEAFFGSTIRDYYENFVKFQTELPQFQDFLSNKSEHFDLLMIEHMPAPFLALKDHFKCPMIGVMSLDAFHGSHEGMGNPTHPVMYPNSFLPFQGELNFLERLATELFHFFNWLSSFNHSTDLNTQAEKYFGVKTDVQTIIDEHTEMLFINANPLFTPLRPLTPGTINLAGGIHMKTLKPLPIELKTFLDSATQGAIYLSFGSNVKSCDLSLEKREIIMSTLALLRYKVLWKFEEDNLQGKPENVMITKWAPQQDVLRHPNVKLFITQGGIQSLEEALYSHVPMVVVPFIGDQVSNAGRVKAKKLGLTLSPEDLTIDSFKDVILQVIEDPKYTDNVKKLAVRIQDQPMPPLETAVWWTEYVLRHKGVQHLKGPKIPVYQYYYLDVFALLGTVIITFMVGSILFLKCVFRKIFMGNSSKDKDA